MQALQALSWGNICIYVSYQNQALHLLQEAAQPMEG